jgi:HlyD family secretion protein
MRVPSVSSKGRLSILLYGSVLLVGGAVVLLLVRPGGFMNVAGLFSSGLASVTAANPTTPPPAMMPVARLAARGRVEPVNEPLQLAIGLVGTLEKVYVNEGDTIKKGQLLAELINGDQKARVDEAAATVQLREAELKKLMNGARPEERREVAAQLAQMKANLIFAQREIERRRALAVSGVASREALDQAVSSLGTADAQTDARQASYDLIMAPPRDEDVAMTQANLALARANLEEQRSLLEKTQLRSPIDGMVLRRNLQTGETISIQPLIPILEVADTVHLRVRAEIDETDVARVALGQRVSIVAAAYPDRRFGGVISRVGQKMGPKTVGSDEPREKNDTKILDAMIDLDPDERLPIGLRVDVFVNSAQPGPETVSSRD